MRNLTLVLLLTIVAACSSDASPPDGAPSAAKQAETQHETEVARRFRTPELRNYLMLPESFIGGAFPKRTAGFLREVQQLEASYIAQLESSAGTSATLIEAHRLCEQFVKQTAELYELMASQPSTSVRAMRNGLEISDAGVHWEYNRRVDEVNVARDRLEKAIQALPAEHQASFRRMSVATRLK